MLAILVITYSFNIIDCNLSEVKRLDIKVRKVMTTHSMHHPKEISSKISRVLTQFELAYKTSSISLFRYLNLSDDWMLQVVLHEKEKVGVDTSCFGHRFFDFGHTNLGMPKFDIKQNYNYK